MDLGIAELGIANESLWVKSYELEDDFGSVESAENVLKLAVEQCPASENLWLLLIRLIYIKQKDTVRAREQLEEAMKVNEANPPFLASSNIWLTAFQVIFESCV